MVLPVAHAGIVVAGKAGDVVESVCALDVAACLADDNGELAFEIEMGGEAWLHNVCQMCRLSIGEASEEGWVLHFGAPSFLAMHLVVQPDTQDLVGIGNYGQPCEV